MTSMTLSPKGINLASQQIVNHFGSRTSIDWLLLAYDAHYGNAMGLSPEVLRASFQSKKHLTFKQGTELVRWKLGSRRVPAFQKKNHKSSVGNVTKQLVQQVGILTPEEVLGIVVGGLKQVGPAAASAFLAAWSSEFPIIDTRAWDALHCISQNQFFAPTSTSGTSHVFRSGDYEAYVEIVRKAAKSLNASPRELEIALYMTGRLNG
jgi:hypothetical protein